MNLEDAIRWCELHDVTLEFRRGGSVFPAEHVIAWMPLGSGRVTWPGRTVAEAVAGLRRVVAVYREEGKG